METDLTAVAKLVPELAVLGGILIAVLRQYRRPKDSRGHLEAHVDALALQLQQHTQTLYGDAGQDGVGQDIQTALQRAEEAYDRGERHEITLFGIQGKNGMYAKVEGHHRILRFISDDLLVMKMAVKFPMGMRWTRDRDEP